MLAQTWWASWRAIGTRMIPGILPPSPTMSATMWGTVPVWLRTCSKLTRLVSSATILVGFLTMAETPQAVVYPFLLAGISVLGAIAGIYYVNKRKTDPFRVLGEGVVVSSLVSAVLYWPATEILFPASFKIGGETHTPFQVYLATLIGLAMTGVIVAITNY